MKFALLGGDDRCVRLCRLLRADGHAVAAFALEKALPDCAKSAADALNGADAVLLPLPAEKGGVLNTPFSGGVFAFPELLRTVPAGTPVLAGMAGDSLRAACAERGLPLYDYAQREDFALLNADLTAEGALSILLDASPRALRGQKVLIAGYGRIGRRLAGKLLPLGAAVTVAARSGAARAEAALDGCGAVTIEDAPRGAGYDAVVNTVPAVVFGAEEIAAFGGAALFELASPPYGFDRAAAEELGKRVVLASGLPGKCAPESAAEAVKTTVYAILSER